VLFELLNSSLIIIHDENVININNKINALARRGMKGEDRMISFTLGHAKLYQEKTKTSKPSPSRLLQVVERPLKLTNKTRIL